MLRDKIKALCKEKGISENKLEQECGIGHATIKKWDKGAPNLTTLKKIADYFGIDLCDLVENYDG